MARLCVSVPDELLAQVRAVNPNVVISRVLQDGLRALLSCRHDSLACAECAAAVDRIGLETAALERFYSDLLWDMERLVRDGATAEGACRVFKEAAVRHGVKNAERIPLPRPSRANRRDSKVQEFLAADRAEQLERRRSRDARP